MRRFLFGVVIASVTAAMPAWAFGGDREIAQAVMSELQQHKAAGSLKGFDIDLKVQDGVVYLTGQVASQAQRALIERAVLKEVGPDNLVSEMQVQGGASPSVMPVAQPMNLMPAAAQQAAPQPTQNDVVITDAVIAKLQQSKAAGALRGFDLDVSTVDGDVWVKGSVANQAQKDLVLDTVRRVRGVARVIDDMAVLDSSPIRQVSTAAPNLMPAGAPAAVPQAYPAPSGAVPGGTYTATPVPMQGAGGAYGVGAPRYDQPNMPSYAWPSYAAYPNYSAVTYPKQYSPSAWPYIGPFYPYPQVPLGWRKVALEWDDGLWYLDFTSK